MRKTLTATCRNGQQKHHSSQHSQGHLPTINKHLTEFIKNVFVLVFICRLCYCLKTGARFVLTKNEMMKKDNFVLYWGDILPYAS